MRRFAGYEREIGGLSDTASRVSFKITLAPAAACTCMKMASMRSMIVPRQIRRGGQTHVRY